MSETRNTKLSYLYRDGSNYKVAGTVIFSGAITLGDRDRLLGGMLPSSDDDLWGVIIPGQVGLADLQDRFYEREVRSSSSSLMCCGSTGMKAGGPASMRRWSQIMRPRSPPRRGAARRSHEGS